MGRDDLDLYGSAGDVRRVAHGVVRVLGALLGAAVALYGAALFALRCFDTCPADPSQDKAWQLLSGAIVLAGVVVVIEAVSFRTRWAAAVSPVVAGLGCLVALAGIASLALIPSIDALGSDDGTTTGAVLAVLLGVGVAVVRRPRREPRD